MNITSKKRQSSSVGSWVLVTLLGVVFLTIVGQQTAILFDTGIAVYGRWFALLALGIYIGLLAWQRRTALVINSRWFLLVYLWQLWASIIWLAQQQINSQYVFEEMVVPLALALAGVALSASNRNGEVHPLKTLNNAFLAINGLLVSVSLIGFVFAQSGVLFRETTRFAGIFTKPTFLSFAAANVLGFVTIRLVYTQSGKRTQILLAVLALAMIAVTVATQVRGTMVAIVAALALVVLPRFRLMIQIAAIAAAGIAVAILLLTPERAPAPLRIGINMQGEIDWNLTSSGRYRLALRSVKELRDNPSRFLFGTAEREDLHRYGSWYVPGDWHDPFARIHSQGLPGFLLYNIILLFPMFLMFANRPRLRSVEQFGLDCVDLYTMSFLFVRMFISSLGDASLQIGHLDYVYYWLTSGLIINLFTSIAKQEAQGLKRNWQPE